MLKLLLNSAICLALLFAAASAQTLEYETVIQKGKTQLEAGSADLALASSQRAIRMNANRWEGYALAGGALMNLKQYEKAADMFSYAIEHAPETKQASLRDLRRKCLLTESGASVTPPSTPSAGTTTQAEIVLWKSIENSSNPNDFKAYLDQYPTGAFVALARTRYESYVQQQRQAEEALAELRSMVKPFEISNHGQIKYSETTTDLSLNGCQLSHSEHDIDNEYWAFDQTCTQTFPLADIGEVNVKERDYKHRHDYKHPKMSGSYWTVVLASRSGSKAIANRCSGWRQESASMFDPIHNRKKKEVNETNMLDTYAIFSMPTQASAEAAAEKVKGLLQICSK